MDIYLPVPEREHDIEIWDTPRRPVFLSEDPTKSPMQVKIRNTKFAGLPMPLESFVESEWNSFQGANPKAQDNMTTYHEAYEREEGFPEDFPQRDTVSINLNTAGFRYQQVFNRTPRNKHLLGEANNHGILTCSTHTHIMSTDDVLLYGTKKNQFDQISGFGGFPQVASSHYMKNYGLINEDTGEFKKWCMLDMHKAVVERLRPEIGAFSERIKNISYVGLVFVGRHSQGLRGTDLDFLVQIDSTADELIEGFEETHQHARKLIPVPNGGAEIAIFIKQAKCEGKTISPYALGCMYNIAQTYEHNQGSEKVAEAILETGGDIVVVTPPVQGNVFESMLSNRVYD